MPSFSKSLALLLTFSSSLLAAPSIKHVKRDQISTAIYAYGDGVNGLPLIFVDNLAYLGEKVPSFGNSKGNITLSTDSTNTTSPWLVNDPPSANNTNVSLAMYIMLNSTSAVGFTPATKSQGDTVAMSGFTWFGNQVAYVTASGEYEMQFWAAKTNTTDLWQLVWNIDGKALTDGVPVSLKNKAPVILELTE